jgi:hypothetical protein
MTDDEANKILDEMKKSFGNLPNPEHSPIQFNYLCKLYKHYHELQKSNQTT